MTSNLFYSDFLFIFFNANVAIYNANALYNWSAMHGQLVNIQKPYIVLYTYL